MKLFLPACLLSLLFIYCPPTLNAQATFQLTYGGAQPDVGYSITPAGNGRFAISGTTESYSSSNLEAMLMVVDTSGTLQWSSHTGTANSEEEAEGIAVLGANVFISGYTDDPGPVSFNGWIQKYDLATGNLLGTRGTGIAVLEQLDDLDTSPSGDLFSTGLSFQNGIDIYVCKWDTSLNLLWSKTVGNATTVELSFDGHATADGGILLFGATSQGTGSDDIIITKLDSNGTLLWTKIYGTTATDFIGEMAESGNGYIAVGRTSANGSNDVLALRLDSGGNLVWAKTYGGTGSDNAFDVKWDGSNYYVAGQTNSFGFGGSDGLLMKLDSSGNVDFARTYGGSLGEVFIDMEVLPGGGMMALGSTGSFGAGQDDIYLVRTDAQGMTGCNDTLYSLSANSISLVSSPPSGIVASNAGSAVSKTWASAPAPYSTDTLCGPPPCMVMAEAALSDTMFCQDDTLFAADISTGATGRTWYLNGSPLAVPNASISLALPSPGQHALMIVATNGVCEDTAIYAYQVFPAPSFNLSSGVICVGDTLLGLNSTPGATNAQWYINGNLVATGLSVTIPTTTLGTYDLTVVSEPGNCSDSTTFSVVPLPSPAFSWVPTGTTVAFSDNSTNAIAWFWDFGDNNTSASQNPQHTYTNVGTYTVCLTVTSADGCLATACDTVTAVVGLASPLLSAIRLYPNPVARTLRLDVPQEAGLVQIELLDVRGQRLRQWEHDPALNGTIEMNAADLASGLYLLRVRTALGEGDLRFLKE